MTQPPNQRKGFWLIVYGLSQIGQPIRSFENILFYYRAYAVQVLNISFKSVCVCVCVCVCDNGDKMITGLRACAKRTIRDVKADCLN